MTWGGKASGNWGLPASHQFPCKAFFALIVILQFKLWKVCAISQSPFVWRPLCILALLKERNNWFVVKMMVNQFQVPVLLQILCMTLGRLPSWALLSSHCAYDIYNCYMRYRSQNLTSPWMRIMEQGKFCLLWEEPLISNDASLQVTSLHLCLWWHLFSLWEYVRIAF